MKLAALLVVCVPALAWADEEPAPAPAEPAPEPAPAPVAEPLPPPTMEELAKDVDELYARQQELERDARRNKATREKVSTLWPLVHFITVYVDVGAFAVGGDGSGIRSDVGHLYFPQYMGRIPGQWVFMGDPLSTAINSLGEPSDTSDSREIPSDTINSEGRPSVVVNAVGLSIGKDIGHGFAVASLAQLLPRPEDTMLDIQLAYVSYRPSETMNLEIDAGKVDSVLGVEYRWQDAFHRLGVTPSLICRYTCGRPLGVRAQLTQGRLTTSATLTNGDNFQQLFEPDRELKANSLPTASGHVQWILPVGQGLELGVSGALGPQDGQPDTSVVQWHYGFDLRLKDLRGVDVAAEFVQGKQPGKTEMLPCDVAPCLTYKGAYVLVDRRVAPWFTPYVRIDWRSAVHTKGAEFVYESHTWRTTIGGQFEVTSRILGKLEYTFNRELGGIPEFPDDVLTSSIVVKTD